MLQVIEKGLYALLSPRVVSVLGKPLYFAQKVKGRLRVNEFKLSHVDQALLVRLDDIGDVVLTTPLLRELRRNLAEAWITLIVKPAIYNLVELCPYIDEVLTYDWDTKGKFRQLRRHVRALKLAAKHLWQRRFELAILPRWDADIYNGAFLTYFSGASWRVGYSENTVENKSRVNNGFDSLFTTVLSGNGSKHEVLRNLDLIHSLGGVVKEDRLEVWTGKDDDEFAEQVLKYHHVSRDKLLIALGAGVREPKRRWPLRNYIEVASWLQVEYGARIMMLGGKDDIPLGEELQKYFGDIFVNMVGKTTLRQMAALLKRCDLFVGNDSGPMHIAAAGGKTVIEISCHPLNGSTHHRNSPKRFGPWGSTHHILQPETARRPCSDSCTEREPHCILGISVEKVKEAIKMQLARTLLN
jgi:heptosyltransferase-2